MRSVSVARALRHARPGFERRMRATCRVERPGKPDPLTGLPSWALVYEGRCYTRYPGLAFEQAPEAGGAVFTVSRLVVRVPFGSTLR